MAIASEKEHRRIVIDGEITRIIFETIEREVKTSDLLTEISRLSSVSSGILPAGCVFYARQMDHKNTVNQVFLLELLAHMQKVIWRKQPETDDEHRHPEDCFTELTLSWPNTLWFFLFHGKNFQSVHLTASKARFIEKGLETELFKLPMPNQYDNGSFCTGNVVADIALSVENRVEKIMTDLLSSTWNFDLPPNYVNTGIDGIVDWSKKSEDPEFHKKLTLHTHIVRTAGEMLRGFDFGDL